MADSEPSHQESHPRWALIRCTSVSRIEPWPASSGASNCSVVRALAVSRTCPVAQQVYAYCLRRTSASMSPPSACRWWTVDTPRDAPSHGLPLKRTAEPGQPSPAFGTGELAARRFVGLAGESRRQQLGDDPSLGTVRGSDPLPALLTGLALRTKCLDHRAVRQDRDRLGLAR